MSEPKDTELERLRQKRLKELKQQMTISSRTPPTSYGVVYLTTQNFDIMIGQGVTLVDFYADWCGPCKMIAPAVERLAKEVAGRATVAKVNVDESMQLAMRFQVQGVPTFAIFKDGQLVHRMVGAVGYQRLKDALMQFL